MKIVGILWFQLSCLINILFLQHIKKNRDPRWDEEFQFVCEEPPIHDKLHVEVISRPSSIGIHSKVPFFVHFYN